MMSPHSIAFGRGMVCSLSSKLVGEDLSGTLRTLNVFLAVGSHRRLMSV